MLFDGTDIYGDDVDPVEVRRRIGMVFQRAEPVPDDEHPRQRDRGASALG